MKGIDLTKLIEGLLVVILISIAIGKYGALQDFARREAIASLHGWGTHAFFQPSTSGSFMVRPTVEIISGGRRASARRLTQISSIQTINVGDFLQTKTNKTNI